MDEIALWAWIILILILTGGIVVVPIMLVFVFVFVFVVYKYRPEWFATDKEEYHRIKKRKIGERIEGVRINEHEVYTSYNMYGSNAILWQ